MAESSRDADNGTRFDALFAAHFTAVRAYVVRRSGAAPVDDVLSETFLVAWRRLDTVPEDALPWLLGVARRVLANQRRGDARRAALIRRLAGLGSRSHGVEPAGDVFGSLGDAIATLSPPEREALLLVAWEGLEPQRAARVVGCTPSAFRARLYRARRRLVAQLGESTLRHFEGRSPEEREAADELRRRVRSAPSPRRASTRRYLLVAAAAVLPVAAVLGLALGIHSLRHLAPAAVAGPPQTILLIGSDHRAGTPFRDVNTDTIMLIRLDPNSKANKVLSVPRDLEVRIPEAGALQSGKLNTAYFYGGPGLLIKILQQQVFPGLKVDHVVDFGFGGFARIVDALGCVYADIDHRYYNNTALTRYSSIDIQPGYQKLCGSDALSFVRFRHTDSDLVREARAQDFIRWAKAQFSPDRIISKEGTLLRIFGENATTDHNLHTTDGLINLFKLVASTLGHPLESIPFPAVVAPCGGPGSQGACYLTATPSAEAAAYQQFITPTTTPVGVATSTAPAPAPADAPASAPTSAGLIPDPAGGLSQAAQLRGAGLPVFYPRLIRAGSRYCSGIAGNCPLETVDPHAYPRAYQIEAGGRSYPAYRMTLVISPSLGQYYGVQGTTWTDPPILAHPTRTETVNGKRLLEFYSSGKLSLVAWKTSGAAYWVSNTLTDSIPAGQLLAIAGSLQPGP